MPHVAMKTPAYTTPGTPPTAEAEMAMMKPTKIAHMGTKTYGQREAPRFAARSENQPTMTERMAAVT